DAALAEIGAILELNQHDLQCHRLAAEIQRRLGHIDRAVTHLEAAVRLDPGDRESRSLLGLLRATTPAAGEASGLQRVLADDTIVEFQHVKPGKGGAFVRTKLKHMRLGKVIDNTFRSGEKVALVDFEDKHMQFLYRDDRYHFMDLETYEQVSLSGDEVGDARDW